MITFRQKLPKPSQAVRAMIRGLKEPKIVINMDTFGQDLNGMLLSWEKTQEICFGCAASVTALEVFPEKIEGYKELYLETDLNRFEQAIDSLRRGHFSHLLNYYEISFGEISGCEKLILGYLDSDYTLEDLICYEGFAEFLEERGY